MCLMRPMERRFVLRSVSFCSLLCRKTSSSNCSSCCLSKLCREAALALSCLRCSAADALSCLCCSAAAALCCATTAAAAITAAAAASCSAAYCLAAHKAVKWLGRVALHLHSLAARAAQHLDAGDKLLYCWGCQCWQHWQGLSQSQWPQNSSKTTCPVRPAGPSRVARQQQISKCLPDNFKGLILCERACQASSAGC